MEGAPAPAYLAGWKDVLLVERNPNVFTGARAARELTLRHPDRVTALILTVPALYELTSPVSVEAIRGSKLVFWIVNVSADFAWWGRGADCRLSADPFRGASTSPDVGCASSRARCVVEEPRALALMLTTAADVEERPAVSVTDAGRERIWLNSSAGRSKRHFRSSGPVAAAVKLQWSGTETITSADSALL
jgi:pimeloyl-ACP methyl ester carboxylesterase